jgi:hypothetical protein
MVAQCDHFLVRPWRSHFPVPAARSERRRAQAAVKTGPPKGARRRLGLEGREHDGTLARNGARAARQNGCSPLPFWIPEEKQRDGVSLGRL